MDYITRFKECCENGELMEMKFEDNLKNNYLKVISNIFYLNIGKVQLNFQRNYIDKKHEFLDDQDAYKKIQEIYNLSLKETRSNVCQFFKIRETEDLSLKTILRLFYYYLPKNHEMRQRMDLINLQINFILDRLCLGYKFSIFFNENHPLLVNNPIDVLLS